MKLRKTLHGMLSMSPAAWYIFIRSIQLCCALLLGATVLLIAWDGQMLEHSDLYNTALALNETAQAVLLIGILLPVCLEDLQKR